MNKRALILTVGTFALLAAACSTAASSKSDTEVRPFTEVQATEAVFENDPTFPDRGIFRITTTEPLICAIVWGETEDLGNFNNSLDMNGTGIVEHTVFLPGAEAGSTYFYRLQGSGADGTLYQSELLAFTLPPATEETSPEASQPEYGENLALGATVAATSSDFSASWSGANAIDGDLATEWSSAGDGDDAFITIDLGSEQAVGAVSFVTRSMADGSAITSTFTVVVDDDAIYGPFPAGTPAEPAVTSVSFSGTTLRFEVDASTGGNTGAVEVEAFAPAG